MSRAPAFCAVILAAGESTRMGRDKALLPWPPVGGGTFLEAAIHRLQDFNDLVMVVVGRNEPSLAPLIYATGASLVRNPESERGQFSSLRVGLQEVLNRGRDAAMVALVDRPPVASRTLQSLRDRFDEVLSQGKWAVIPEHNGKHGHPMLIDREMIEVFLKAPATATARDIKRQFGSRIAYLAVNDPMVALNVNTPEDYAALCSTG